MSDATVQITVTIDSFDLARFFEELHIAAEEHEGVTIRTGSRSFSAAVETFKIDTERNRR